MLILEADPATSLTVREVERRGEIAAWDAWERDAARCRTTVAGPGGERLRALAALRCAAVTSRSVRRLGVLRDGLAAVELPTRVAAVLQDGGEVQGPGGAWVRIWPIPLDGGLVRLVARVELNGRPVLVHDVASTGYSATTFAVWIPPGRHEIAVDTGGLPADVEVEVHRPRPRWTAPLAARSVRTDADEAEARWLAGDPGATDAWRALLEAPGPTGELARARVIAGSSHLIEVEALATGPAATADGAEALADAVLMRAADLPIPVVLAAVMAARDPDPVAVARWLDGPVAGTRAAGVALLGRAPDVPAGRSTRIDAARELAVATRAARLAGAGEPIPLLGAAPGTPRGQLRPGDSVEVTLAPRADGRAPVLRMDVRGPATWAVDGEERVSPGGRLDTALPAGAHRIDVRAGSIVLLDPELAPDAPIAWEREAVALPATFALPDPGVRTGIFVDLRPAAPGVAVFDDGRTVRWDAATRVELDAGAVATEVTLYADALASVALRGRIPAENPAPAALPDIPLADALAAIEALTRATDGGDAGARAARAGHLAALGLLESARRSVRPLGSAGSDALERSILAAAPSRPAPGPVTAGAALAESGIDLALPLDPRERAVALDAVAAPPPLVRVATADAWLAAADPVRAARAAVASGRPEPLERALGALDFRPIARPDRSAGLVPVPFGADPPSPTLAAQIRAALLASPWPAADGLVVRGDASDRLVVTGDRVHLDVFCRDEALEARPCRVTLGVDGATQSWTLADAEVRGLDIGPGRHEILVRGPGDGSALVVRAQVDGTLLPPRSERLAIRVTPSVPATVQVAGGAVLRVDVASGTATASAGGATGSAGPGGTILLPVPDAAPVGLRIEGDAVVTVYRGAALPPDDRPPPPPPVDPASLLPEWIPALFAHVPVPAAESPASLRAAGTTRFGLLALHDVRESDYAAWDTLGVTAEWMRSTDAGWAAISGWLDGPAFATGGAGELGWRWRTGRVSLGVDAGTSVLPAVAAHLGGTGELVQGLRLADDTRLSARIGMFAGSWSVAPSRRLDPNVRVDPRAWTLFAATHPFGAFGQLSVIGTPRRNLRFEAGGRATTNPGPSLDRAGGFAGVDWLIGSTTQVGVDGNLQWRFADALRSEGRLRPWVDLTLDHAWWVGERGRRIGVAGLLTALPRLPALEGWVGVTVTSTAGRGLRDLPPDEEAFRALRELP